MSRHVCNDMLLPRCATVFSQVTCSMCHGMVPGVCIRCIWASCEVAIWFGCVVFVCLCGDGSLIKER